jgi:DNA-binding CsgD family transcriptional regulator
LNHITIVCDNCDVILSLFPTLVSLPRRRQRARFPCLQLVLLRPLPGGGFSTWRPPAALRQLLLATTRRTGKLVAIIPFVGWAPPCGGCPLHAGCRELCAEAACLVPAEEPFNFRERPKDPETTVFLASIRYASEHARDDDAPDPDARLRVPWPELVTSSREALHRAIETLTPAQREAVRALLAGKRQCDIARDAGKTKETVCILLRRARLRLRRALVTPP